MNRADEQKPSGRPDPPRSPGQFEKRARSTPETNTTPFLAREDIIDGIKEVAAELRHQGAPGTMRLVGGAAIVPTVNADRRLTRDIDAVLAPKAEINRAARAVAERRRLPADSLNDDTAQFLPNGFGRAAEWTTLYQDDTITIQAATHGTLLAMKLHAGARRGAREAEDIADLLNRVGITTLDDAEVLHGEFYPATSSRLRPPDSSRASWVQLATAPQDLRCLTSAEHAARHLWHAPARASLPRRLRTNARQRDKRVVAFEVGVPDGAAPAQLRGPSVPVLNVGT